MNEQYKYLSQLLKKKEPTVPDESVRPELENSDASDNETDQENPQEQSEENTARSKYTIIPDCVFAEVVIDSSPTKAPAPNEALRYFNSLAPAEEKITKTQDPIRMRFYEMRSLSTSRPFARSSSELFYKQAKYMEDFTDSYGEKEAFHMYYPFYQHMSYEQLRTYFTWRNKFRKGIVEPASVSYLFVYVYELLHNIGVRDPAEGLDMLLAVWNSCLDFAPMLESYLPGWFKDYHIYYNLPQNFSDFVKEQNLYRYFPVPYLFDESIDNSLELWNGISGYDITKSIFYNQGNEQLMKDCFDAVLKGIKKFCIENKLDYNSLFVYTVSRRTIWQPFKQALFFDWHKQEEGYSVSIPGQGEYYYKNNRFASSVPIYYSLQKDLVGYIIKKTEACLRKQTNYKNKLTPVHRPHFYESFRELKELDKKGIGLAFAIENAVADFHKHQNLKVVTVDIGNLDRIRQEALGIQEKLIVPEDDGVVRIGRGQEQQIPAAALSVASGSGPYSAEKIAASDFIAENDELPKDDLPIEAEAEAETEAKTALASSSQSLVKPSSSSDMTEAALDGWASLKISLSGLELETLTLLASGEADIKAYADKNDIMLEVLADSINEKACDHIGDSILDTGDGMSIYEEYKDNIKKMLSQR